MSKYFWNECYKKLDERIGRSAWNKGVKAYAADMIADLETWEADGYFTLKKYTFKELQGHLLNGARDWSEYSWGGSSLIYDCDIAKLLCTPSELKRTRNGERQPNSQELWLDVQARALFQAARIAYAIYNGVYNLYFRDSF